LNPAVEFCEHDPITAENFSVSYITTTFFQEQCPMNVSESLVHPLPCLSLSMGRTLLWCGTGMQVRRTGSSSAAAMSVCWSRQK